MREGSPASRSATSPTLKVHRAPGGDPQTITDYDATYAAAYDAIKSVEPGAPVIARELAGRDICAWLGDARRSPARLGTTPTGSPILRDFVQYIKPAALLISEDGTLVGEPNQLGKDLELVESARRAGASEFVFYQLSRADESERRGWNTGIE